MPGLREQSREGGKHRETEKERAMRVDDGKHVCPIMTRTPDNPAMCRDDCACIGKWEDRNGEVYTFCGMMPD